MQETLPAPTQHEETRAETALAPLWNVVFHNDDETTMDFVVGVLMRFFHHSAAEAYEIMMTVHSTGCGIAGTYPLELAELKAEQTISAARPWFPLQVTVEVAD